MGKLVGYQFNIDIIIAFASESNHVTPPMLIFHRKRLNREVVDDFCIKGIIVTVSTK